MTASGTTTVGGSPPPTRTVISSGTVTVTSDGAATGAGGAERRRGAGGAASGASGAISWSASARCGGSSGSSRTNFRIRLTRIPSFMNPPSSWWSGAGTLAWCSATTSHWSLNTGEPDDPGSVSAA